jgi:acyl CoA:acetate/3-ketoacid CoA transferase
MPLDKVVYGRFFSESDSENKDAKPFKVIERMTYELSQDELIVLEIAPKGIPLFQHFSVEAVVKKISLHGDLYVDYFLCETGKPTEQKNYLSTLV